MNDTYNPNQPPSLEEQLTAWLLQELSSEEADAIQVRVDADPKLQKQVQLLKQTLRLIEEGKEMLEMPPEKVFALQGAGNSAPRFSLKPLLQMAALLAVGVFLVRMETADSELGLGLTEKSLELASATFEVAPSSSPSAPGTVSVPFTPSVPFIPPTATVDVGIGGGFAGRYGGRSGRGRRQRAKQSSTSRILPSELSGKWQESEEADFNSSQRFKDISLELKLREQDLEVSEELKRQSAFHILDGYGHEHRGMRICEHLHPLHPEETPQAMFFRFYGDNAFVPSSQNALATFAADVDSASYPLVRNYLVKKDLPSKDAVRTEEFVNYFTSDLPGPSKGDFSIQLEAGKSLFGDSKEMLLLKVGIKAREVARGDRKPLNLVFVVDRSGSMNRGNRMALVKKSLGLLVDQIDAQDSIALVSFNGTAHLELEPTTGEERWKIRDAVQALETGGSTNVADGLLMGYARAEQAFRKDAVNRVILCSDGVANTGETDQKRILEQVRAMSEQAIDLTTIGVGMGNHNDVLLEQLADQGNGSCHYVDDYQEAKRIFVEGFTGTLQTVARDVKIQVEFDPSHILRWRQLGYENRAVAAEDFRNDAVDAGEIGAGHEVVALFEVQLASHVQPVDTLATVRLRWFPDGSKDAQEMEQSLHLGESATSAHHRLSAVAAQFAEVLRRSVHAEEDEYDTLLAESEALVQLLPKDTSVAELRDMILQTRNLVEALPEVDPIGRLVREARKIRILEAELRITADRTEKTELFLQELAQQNAELERRIQEHIQGGMK
ncbi:MAG: von Willebrand factor type A domain-containing protein [Planctomycetota bacterium]|nr:von Willebrand factor type A domain-containing protein [Planctomycetota bacterium]